MSENPLTWWKTNKVAIFPLLQKRALQYMQIPADVKRSHLQRKKEYTSTKCCERDSLYTQEFLDFGFSINLNIVSVLFFLWSAAFRQKKYKINICILFIYIYKYNFVNFNSLSNKYLLEKRMRDFIFWITQLFITFYNLKFSFVFKKYWSIYLNSFISFET